MLLSGPLTLQGLLLVGSLQVWEEGMEERAAPLTNIVYAGGAEFQNVRFAVILIPKKNLPLHPRSYVNKYKEFSTIVA